MPISHLFGHNIGSKNLSALQLFVEGFFFSIVMNLSLSQKIIELRS